MAYDLGINIVSNTFKGGQLTLSLTGVGSNGTKIADIEKKSITKTSGFFKIGTGSFANANGATHIYTINIYFKDNGKDQNFNQEAVFNAKFDVKEQGSQVAKASQNHEGKRCYTSTPTVAPADGDEYPTSAGQYIYKYNYYWNGSSWVSDSSQNGWGVKITDSTSTAPITEELCAYINDKPVVSMDYMFYNSKATSIDLSTFDTSKVTNMNTMFYHVSSLSTLDLSNFDTSNVTTMEAMFNETTNLTFLDISSFDTSNVTKMTAMFASTSSLTTLDLSNFDTSNVTYMEWMFQNTSATVGYARSQADADRFNNVAGSLANGNNPNTYIPNTLQFVIK